MHEGARPVAGRERWALAALLAVAAGLVLRQVLWQLTGEINEDELEVLQVLWLWDHGDVPYRDYVYPHSPVLQLLLWPIYRLYGPTPELVVALRWVTLPVTLGVLAQVVAIGRRVTGAAHGGALTLVLALTAPRVAASIVELRTDTLALPLVLGAIQVFARYLAEPTAPSRLVVVGALLGSSALLNQKGVFVGAMVVLVAERFHAGTLGLELAARLARLGRIVGPAVAVPAAGIALLFAVGWLETDGVALLATTGQFAHHQGYFPRYRLFLAMTGIALAPVPWLGGALGAGPAVRRALRTPALAPVDGLRFLVAGTVLASVAYLAASNVWWSHLLVLPSILVAVQSAHVLLTYAARAALPLAIGGAVVAAVLDPVAGGGRAEQLARMRWVLAHVPEDAPVVDGRYGLEAFRPLIGPPGPDRLQQYRPWIYEPGLWARHDAAVISALASRRVGAVVVHPNHALLPPGVAALIERNYAPTERSDVLLPRERPWGPVRVPPHSVTR